MTETPFETDENGSYLVAQPAQGMTPASITIALTEGTFRLSGYQGRHRESRVQPDVLRYEDCQRVMADGN